MLIHDFCGDCYNEAYTKGYTPGMNQFCPHHRLLPLIFCLLITLLPASKAYALVDNLFHPIDIINNDGLSQLATHTISFTLPNDSFPIKSTDYIQIYFPTFSNVTLPTHITGEYSGVPVYILDGKYIKITGIVVLPNARITIEGITAINPPLDTEFQISIFVTQDLEGTIVKNRMQVVATPNPGTVTVSASIDSALANLRISGFSAPDTFLFFGKDDAVLGTDVVDSLGTFTRLFTGLQPTTHRITVYGVDSNNLSTSPIPLQIYTPAYQETSMTNLLLSPTLQLNLTTFTQGDSIIASGSAMPGGSITLFTDSPLRTYYASASATGSWTYTLTNSAEYVPGDYRIYSLVHNSYGLQSLNSNSLTFSIRSSISGGGSACGDISRGDLNCDSSIDLTDFSILMYYWSTSNATADVNTDTLVNLTDFSIMMYYWGT